MDPMQAKQTKDAETAKKDLRDIMNVVITLNALLKVAKDAGDGDLQKSLQETIFQEDKKMVDAVAAWVMATRGEPEKEDRSDEQEKAIDSSLERMRKQADRNEKAGAREKSYDGNDEKQISRLQKAGVLLGFGCNTSEPFKSYPQWKPRTSTGGNSKLEVDTSGIGKNPDDVPESSGTSKQKLSIDSLVKGQMEANKTDIGEEENGH